MKLSAVGMYRTGMLLRVLKLAMFCAIATHISTKYETRAPEGRHESQIQTPIANLLMKLKYAKKALLLSRGRKAVKKNATFNLSDIEKRLRDVEERYVFKLFCSLKNPYSIQLRKLL